MKFLFYSAIVAASSAVYLMPVSARAQEGTCSCLTAYKGPTSPIGTVLSSVGNVMVLQRAGYVDAAVGSELAVGSRVITGARSSAAVGVGAGPACRVELTENSSLDVSLADNNVCLNVQKEVTTSVPAGQGAIALQNGIRIITPATLFGGVAIGAAILSATNDGKPVSQ